MGAFFNENIYYPDTHTREEIMVAHLFNCPFINPTIYLARKDT